MAHGNDAVRITLLTDFGTADGYVAALKGVIAAIAPAAIIDDASHDIEPGDVAAAAWALAGYWRLYPVGTIHVAVVDPAVGSARRALAARIDGSLFVAPDNGVLTRALDSAHETHIVAIENPRFQRDVVSATFHGRDIFAPVAAHLANGVSLNEIGRVIDDPIRLHTPAPQRDGDAISGQVVHIDRFGNLITNIPAEQIDPNTRIGVGGLELPLQRTYADARPGEPLALIGSRGLLEIAVRDGSAADVLGVGLLDSISVQWT